jgi:hypothetical protein
MTKLGNVTLRALGPQDDLPGPKPRTTGEVAYRCNSCGTRLRPGQPHTALVPYPHQTFAMLAASPSTTLAVIQEAA